MNKHHYTVCKHEAAHVVVALYYHIIPSEVISAGMFGYTRFSAEEREEGEELQHVQDHAEEYAAAYLAGLAYERDEYHARGGDLATIKEHCISDIGAAQEIFQKKYFPLQPDQTDALVKKAEEDALEILMSNRPFWDELTGLLYRKMMLKWEDIKELAIAHIP